MGRTLEDFFVHGKQHNSLSNRTFVRIDGRLMEQRATDLSEVSSERPRQPTFHDLTSGKVKRMPFNMPDHSQIGMMGGIYRGADALNMSVSGNRIAVEQYTPEGFLKLLRNPPAAWGKSGFWMEAYRAFAKDPEWKAQADAIIRRNAECVGVDVDYQEQLVQRILKNLDMPEPPSGEELAERFKDLKESGQGIVFTVDSFTSPNAIADSVAARRLAKLGVQRAQLTLGNIVDAKHKFRSGNLEIEAGVVEDWILRAAADPEIDMARAMEIDRLIKGDMQCGAFVSKILKYLSEPSTQEDPNDYDFSPAILRQLNHMQLFELFKQARPIALAVTDIGRAFKAVQAVHPEVKYVYFDEHLRWKHVDRNFEGIEVGTPEIDDLLETAALVAVDRGLLGKWLNPAA